MNSWAGHSAGGKRGFDKVIWDSERIAHPSGKAVRLTYTSKDGKEASPTCSVIANVVHALSTLNMPTCIPALVFIQDCTLQECMHLLL